MKQKCVSCNWSGKIDAMQVHKNIMSEEPYVNEWVKTNKMGIQHGNYYCWLWFCIV